MTCCPCPCSASPFHCQCSVNISAIHHITVLVKGVRLHLILAAIGCLQYALCLRRADEHVIAIDEHLESDGESGSGAGEAPEQHDIEQGEAVAPAHTDNAHTGSPVAQQAAAAVREGTAQ